MNKSNEIINRKLAEFEGHIYHTCIRGDYIEEGETEAGLELYTESVDACLPLIEKLKENFDYNLYYSSSKGDYYWYCNNGYSDIETSDKSLSKALSLALYEVIGELK